MPADSAVIDKFTSAAQFWDKHRERIRQMYAPVSEALIQAAGIAGSNTVLDIASGAGEPALTIAAFVGPKGKVIGVDPVPEMLAAARQAASQAGLTNLKFEHASADRLPFPDGSFDVVVCRFGIMFFPSPETAIREMLRVLKPGGKLALAVWSFAEHNPYHYVLSRIIDRYTEPVPTPPDAAEPFRFATPGKLLALFQQAGVNAATERILHFPITAPISVEDFWTLRCEMSLRERLAKLSPEQLIEVRSFGLPALREYSTGDGISFPGEVLIVSGLK